MLRVRLYHRSSQTYLQDAQTVLDRRHIHHTHICIPHTRIWVQSAYTECEIQCITSKCTTQRYIFLIRKSEDRVHTQDVKCRYSTSTCTTQRHKYCVEESGNRAITQNVRSQWTTSKHMHCTRTNISCKHLETEPIPRM